MSRGDDMLEVGTDEARAARRRDLDAQDRDILAETDAARRGDKDFTKVYPKGWARLQVLIKENPSAARVYAWLAANIDGQVGAVVVSQEVMARDLEVAEITVRRHTKVLEDMGALVRIKVGTGVYAYALDPEEIWKSWADRKDQAAFVARTLVRKSDKANSEVRRRLSVMIGEK
jgi:DNA-binding transcriptional ArsR family regulator